MTRKDTIIIAVLVNAAILFAIFISAIRTDKKEEKLSIASEQVLQGQSFDVAEKSVATVKSAEGDEIDQVLKAQFPSMMSSLASSAGATDAQTAESSLDKLNAIPELPTDSQNTLSIVTALDPVEAKSDFSTNSESVFKQVVVKKGDALEKIARANRCKVDELMKWNNLRSSSLRVGQVLKVRPNGQMQTARNANIGGTPVYYTVKSGDNPWTISVKNHIKIEQLLKLNNLNSEKARQLKPGDKLRIR